jgi:hypothetical protein
MRTITCPTCDGVGRITPETPVTLSPLQAKIYAAVRRARPAASVGLG